MAVAQTSILSYYQLKNDAKLGHLQTMIYDIIKENSTLSNRDIAQRLNLEICTVTGRVNELCAAGLIVSSTS